MAYGGSPTSTNNDGLRVAVGDTATSTAGEFLADADYAFVRTLASGYWSRAAIAARMVGANFANGALMKKVGDLTIQKGDRVTYYKNLASQFEGLALADAQPFLGGRSQDDKDAAEDDSDRVAPWFQRGLHDFDRSTST